MTDHQVVIAGGGPTGLMLAAELAIAGVEVVVVERRANQDLDGSRSGGLHARTVEILDQRGVAERFLEGRTTHPIFAFAGAPLPIGDMPTRYSYTVALWQSEFEKIMADWVIDELGVQVLRSREVVGLAQDGESVDVALSDGTTLRAQYLVGCDGGRSFVRKAAGIDFPGLDASKSWMIAEVELADESNFGIQFNDAGQQAMGRRAEGEPVRIVLTERTTDHDGEPTMEDLRAELISVYGSDLGVHSPSWISRFTDTTRQAASYRAGRVFVAGDAAHIHPPMGGQGMGTGVQDAVNLGWKLAQVVHGESPDALLDTYHDERHPVGARVLRNTRTQVILGRMDELSVATKDTMAELATFDEPRRAIGANLASLDIHYDLGEGHPLLGRRMPDLDLETGDGPTRVYAFLHEARPVLLNFGAGDFPSGRVRLVNATFDGVCELPVIGEVELPSAVLIRPDGYVAWTGDLSDDSLKSALNTWFGIAYT